MCINSRGCMVVVLRGLLLDERVTVAIQRWAASRSVVGLFISTASERPGSTSKIQCLVPAMSLLGKSGMPSGRC
eukprot:scaffold2232_cov365-Prasinococcus_capsulatus_cf.AAC.5